MSQTLDTSSIASFISQAHNPGLIKREESPNGNIIFHIYSDGELTSQKGGWAYLQRSVFTVRYPSFKKNYVDLFPIKTTDCYRRPTSYAIVTEEDGKKIISMIQELEKQS